MNKKMVYFVLAAFLLSLVLLAGCGQQQKQAASTNTGKKVVKIGSETTFPPLNSKMKKPKIMLALILTWPRRYLLKPAMNQRL